MTDTTKREESAAPQTGDVVSTVPKKERAAGTTPRLKKGGPGLSGPWMYVGPTVPGIGIQNRVYTEIPADAAERVKEVPEVGLLFIPVRDYPMANRMLREGAGYIHDAYCKVAQIRRGGDGA